ncbi:MAG: MBL fold metallo-hydrolase, partial [Clostridia bacterium]|nr:MBL fold metallo-hydrolase [Clostridia bacterium]
LRGENKILLFELSGYKLAFMGDYGESYNDNVVKALSGVDVLFIPIGGKYTINSETAVNYIKEIKPKTVIPIHYKVDGSNIDIKGPNEFLKLVKEYNIKSSPYNYNGEKGVILLSPISEV